MAEAGVPPLPRFSVTMGFWLPVAVGACLLGVLGFGIRTALASMIALVSFGPALLHLVRRREDGFNPAVLIPLTYGAFALAPLTDWPSFSEDTWTQYLALQALAVVALRCGLTLVPPAGRRSPALPVRSLSDVAAPPASTSFLIAALVLLSGAIPSIATQASAFGGLSGMLAVGYGGERNVILSSATVLGSGFEWWLLGSAMLAFYGLRRRFRWLVLASVVLYAVVAWLLLKVGQRNPIVNSVIFAAVLYHYGHRPIPHRQVLVGLIVGIMIVHFVGLARFFLAEGLGRALSETWAAVKENPAALAPWSINQFRGPSRSLAEILQYGGPSLQLGRSYLDAVASAVPFLPRALPGIGFSPLQWRMETFYADVWVTGGRYGFSPVAEGLLNFGIAGVALSFFFYGRVARWVWIRVQHTRSVVALLAYAGALPMLMLNVPSNQAATVVYQWTRAYLLPCLIFWAIQSVWSRMAATSAPLRSVPHERLT
jgi:oligosaccharide repeat unit polymerase